MENLAERLGMTETIIQRTALLSIALVLAACSPQAVPTATEPPATLEQTPTPSVQVPPEATASPKPTSGPTPTVWPPVLDIWSLEDIRSLDSFVVTVNEKNTVNGQLTARRLTTGYIRDPLSAYFENEYSGGVDRTYVVHDRTYALTGSGDWYISAGASDDVFHAVDIPAQNTGRLADAKFAGEEEYQGIPAYHFVLEAPDSAESDGSELVGDFFVAIDGNYVLYSHWMETSRQGDFSQIFEMTEAMSSIGQLTGIELPAAMKDMPSTSDVPLDLKLPLPPDSAFRGMIRYRGFGVDDYYFSTPRTSIDEFLDYYRALPPTDGWTVSHVGHVRLHEDDCEFTRECVILNKGSTQVVLYYDGAEIRAEFDWPHLYSPLD